MNEPDVQLDPAALPEEPPRPVSDVPWRVADAVFVLGLWLVTATIVGGLALVALAQVVSDRLAEALSLPITMVAMLGVVLLYVQRRYPGNVRRLFGPARPTWTLLGLGLGAGVVAFLVFGLGLGLLLDLLIRAVRGVTPTVQESFREIARDPSNAPLLVFGAVFIAPLAEELCFRGLLFSALRKWLPLWPAMGLSGLAFGLTHIQTTLDGYLLVVVIIMPLGMFLAYVYERSRTLVVPIAAHAVFNLVQVVLLIRNPG